MDNFNTPSASLFYETFAPEEAKRIWDKFEFVFTPKHCSWLNMAEIELHSLNRQCLNRHISSPDVGHHLQQYSDRCKLDIFRTRLRRKFLLDIDFSFYTQ